ncbi:hypothetical protein X975_10090, partial [Stegodyphus mimosarum]
MKNAVINNDIRTFWELDSIGILTESEELSMKDKQIIDQFENSLSFNNVRYQIKLLWKSIPDELNNNFQIAKRRFEILKAKLDKDIEVREEYTKIIEEQLQNGIVEVYQNKDLESGYYMPHRAVIRPDKETSRVRIVFDASSKGENSKSLNDLSEAGLNLNPNILDVILKFREHNIAFSADIEKAFLMINIAEEDRKYLKFFWFQSDN